MTDDVPRSASLLKTVNSRLSPKILIRILALAAILAATVCALFGICPGLWQPAAIAIATTLLWATGALPEDQTALIFFASASLSGISRPDVVLSGFTTGALWLVFGGLVIGAAVRRTGLDRAIAAPVIARVKGTYTQAVFAITLLSLILSFLVPSSMTRVILMMPVVLAICDALGMPAGRGRHGLVVTAVLMNYYFGIGILPANVPNMALVGSLEKNLHIHLQFADYFFTYFPALSLLKAALAAALISFAYRVPIVPARRDDAKAVADAPGRKLVALVLVVALLLWITDFAHGISPAWIALTVAIIFMFPGIDIVPVSQFSALVNIRPLFFVAGILGLGNFIAVSGLGSAAAVQLASLVGLNANGSIKEAALLIGIASAMGLLATHGGMAAMLPSLAQDLARLSGLPIDIVIGTIVVGYSILLFPYQVPPTVVGFQMAQVPHRAAAVSVLWIGLVTSIVAVPCQFLWWRLIGFR